MPLFRRHVLLLVLLIAVHPAMAIEEPAFDVLHSTEDYEIRRYAPYIVAEVDVEGELNKVGGDAFRILAGYIFGKNEPGTKMSMTAPVTSQPAGERMQMTSPVISDAPDSGRDSYTFAFVMESRYSMETLPKPIDPRIRIVEKPAQVLAARRYSGRWSDKNFRKHEAALLAALQLDAVEMLGEIYLARYNSPFTPWFLRRNELLVEVAWALPNR